MPALCISYFNKAEIYENEFGTIMSQGNVQFSVSLSRTCVSLNLMHNLFLFFKRNREIFMLDDLVPDLFIHTASIAVSL